MIAPAHNVVHEVAYVTGEHLVPHLHDLGPRGTKCTVLHSYPGTHVFARIGDKTWAWHDYVPRGSHVPTQGQLIDFYSEFNRTPATNAICVHAARKGGFIS